MCPNALDLELGADDLEAEVLVEVQSADTRVAPE